ncbi:hypothetical protein DACRYDRAFT_24165 [Dacryopinax primogenitus]|uniref:Uncharacterized protein n=1 Tax=Dacryopinax primogenitus (strain DJM 731) TaxID=1858805 RepID=M5FZX5_DACPD|nr:uncharacterized protein DACRYDRAFT_24165 [Dacryopinax primogenitus]EJT99111.1 hypothetical protein DACRYDRAFT_24165 [Dacryopinax primogenitus]
MRDPQLWERALTPDGRENPPNPWAVGFDPDEPRYPPMSNSPFLAPTHTAPAAGAARRELTQQQSHRLDVGGAKGKEVEGFLQRQPRVLDTDLAAGWQARTRQSEGSGAEGVLLPDMSEEDDRTYDDGKRRFTFPVHQFVFYDPKMKAKMFPDRRPHPKGFKKR